MTNSPIILVPGFWLGAWAWDTVSETLRADGHDVTALTLPGLEPDHPDRASVGLSDQAEAIAAAVRAAGRPVVLAVHSGAGAPGYAATDLVPEGIAAMVYVDTGPANGPLDAEFEGDVHPLPAWEDLDENLDGISEEQLAEFRARAVPEPGNVMRDAHTFTNDARKSIPTTAVCTAFTSEQYKEALEAGYPFLGGYADLDQITWIDLPTSHWPMWSKPQELSEILGSVAAKSGGGA
jgi:pimeloyl-ACP methyl ester carboxylesterase